LKHGVSQLGTQLDVKEELLQHIELVHKEMFDQTEGFGAMLERVERVLEKVESGEMGEDGRRGGD
jgi:hypothetical protein